MAFIHDDCFLGVGKYPELSVSAIDLAPACDGVYKADFITTPIMSEVKEAIPIDSSPRLGVLVFNDAVADQGQL